MYIVQAGELMYCKNQQQTVCCAHKHECVKDWTNINNKYTDKAIEFLTNKVIEFKFFINNPEMRLKGGSFEIDIYVAYCKQALRICSCQQDIILNPRCELNGQGRLA